MCGGDLAPKPGSTIATCEYCGTAQTVPAIDDDKRARLYNRANQYRMDCQFDKAYAAYESIVNDQPDEAEAYWGMLLSEYGVEYVDDPKTGKKVPTCHRTLTRSVTSSANYKAACQYADAESRILYEDDAAVLDALQKQILNASAREEPYDVFICYKESDEAGNRTADSVLAQDIYDALTAKGMRVFFSRISLEDKLGQDYEPCIFAALNSAKVMLMVTTSSDHCSAVWVKNEWKRYLDFMKNDPSKTLIPVYKDISPYTLPDEFARFQAQDMGKLGAIQDLVRGVEKILGGRKAAAPGGMSQEEKKAFNSVKRSQQTSRFMFYLVLFAVIAFCGTMLLRDMDLWPFGPDQTLAIIHGEPSYVSEYDYAPLPLLLPVFAAVPLAITLAYGFKSKGSHWADLIYLILISALAFYLRTIGIRFGSFIRYIYGFIAFFPILTSVTAYLDRKKSLAIHLGITLLVTAVTWFL